MWFRKTNTDKKQSLGDTTAKKIAENIIAAQIKAARKLHELEARYSIAVKKRALVIAFLCCAAYCSFLLIKAFFGSYQKTDSLFMQPGSYKTPAMPRTQYQKKDSTHPYHDIIKP